MRISMQILADRLRQNYPDCSFGELSGEMNLKRPLFIKAEQNSGRIKFILSMKQISVKQIFWSMEITWCLL